MRALAAAALLATLTSTALAQPGMTPPTYGAPSAPPPVAPAPAPAPAPYGPAVGYGYQPAYAQPPQQPQLDVQLKSSSTAVLWSIGATVAGIAALGAAFDNESEGLLLLGMGLTLVGPSAGHIYAGEGMHAVKGTLLRSGGLLVFTLGAFANASVSDCYDAYYCEDSNDGETAMWVGGLIVVGSALYDFYDAGRAANRYNDKQRRAAYQFAPTMMSKAGGGVTPGVGVIGSF